MVASGEAEGPPSDRPDGAAPVPASETPRATSPALSAASGASPRRSRVGSPRVARVSPIERDVPPEEEDDDLGPGIPELLDDDALADLGVARGSRTGLAAAIPLPPEPAPSSAGPSSSEGVFVRGPASSSSTRFGVSTNSIFSNGPKSTPYPGERASTGGAGDGKDSLRRLFNLPDDEQLVEEYLCALYKKILLQGRMYLFTDHVCFYSNVFGYTKIKTIALKDVTIVKRAYTVQVVPNAVEIVHKGKTEFFTSFIFPDKAYKTIAEQWRRCSRYSKIFAAQDVRARRDDVNDAAAAFDFGGAAPSPEVAAMLGVSTPSANDDAPAGEEQETLWRRRRKKAAAAAAAAAAREGGGGPSSTGSRSGAEDASTNGSPRSAGGGPASDGSSSSASAPVPAPVPVVDERTRGGDDASRRRRRKSAPFKSATVAHGRRASTPAAFAGSAATRGSAEAPAGREETDDATRAKETAGATPAAAAEDSDDEGAEAESDADADAEYAEANAEANAVAEASSARAVDDAAPSSFEAALASSKIAVPIRPADMQTLRETTLECTVSEFFELGWSDAARDGFAAACHESRGETNVRATEWSRHRHHGHARDITFVAPVNATFGPKTTNCHQTQSYHACRGGVLVVDTSQVQTDIPYGDYFRVESRWEVSPAPPRGRAGAEDATPRCSVWVGLRIPFHRSTMLRKVIEQSALEESRKSADGTLAMMRARLAARDAHRDEDASADAGGLGSPFSTGTVPSPRLDRPGGNDVDGVDVSKLIIPEGSRDVIWRMLFGGGTRRPGSGDATPLVDVAGAGFANGEASAGASPSAPSLGRGSGERRGGIGGTVGSRGASPTSDGVAGRLASPFGKTSSRDGPSPRVGVGGGGGGGGFGSGFGFAGGAAFVLVAALVGIAAVLVAWRGVRFGAAWMGVGEGFSGEYWYGGGAWSAASSAAGDVARWRRRATALEEELRSLERRAAFVAGEAAHARAALEEAIARLEG